MSALLNAAGAVLDDRYTLLADDADVPTTGAVIVSLARWQAEQSRLAERTDSVAVQLPNTVDVQTLAADVLARPMLVLSFPGFADGRAYSQAHLLRERLGYTGVLRATGAAVVADQLLGMRRCGITEFQLRDDQLLATCTPLLAKTIELAYQPALDARQIPLALRR